MADGCSGNVIMATSSAGFDLKVAVHASNSQGNATQQMLVVQPADSVLNGLLSVEHQQCQDLHAPLQDWLRGRKLPNVAPTCAGAFKSLPVDLNP